MIQKILFTAFITLISTHSRADLVANLGILLGSLSSENKDDAGEPKFKVNQIGFRGEAESVSPRINFYGAFFAGFGSGNADYNFTDSVDPLETASVKDLKVSSTLSKLSVGTRWKIIRAKKFRFFIGGGYDLGLLSLTYDKEHFKKLQGNTTGFEERESQTIQGPFAEAGMEFITTNSSGLRIAVIQNWLRTKKFETLDDEELIFNQIAVSVGYIRYVDTRF